MSSADHTAASPWLVRQLCEVAGEPDRDGLHELEMLAARIEQRLKQRGAATDQERSSRQ